MRISPVPVELQSRQRVIFSEEFAQVDPMNAREPFEAKVLSSIQRVNYTMCTAIRSKGLAITRA